MIPEAAVEAAWDKLHENPVRPIGIDYAELAAALEAAAPHMLAGEVVGDIERIAPNTLRAGDTISHNGILYIRSTAEPEADLDCQRCDLDMHVCGGCGEPLRHDGKMFDGTTHKACT